MTGPMDILRAIAGLGLGVFAIAVLEIAWDIARRRKR